MGKYAIVLGVLLLCGTLALAKDKKKQKQDDDPSANLKFVVLKDATEKPVRNASVVLHEVDRHGNQGRGGYELKTDPEGRTSFDGVPYGKLRVQVLAPGYQTFGQDYEINQPEHEIVIKLKPPQGQYSVYK